jgi:methyl-accepting chemotaxis protein
MTERFSRLAMGKKIAMICCIFALPTAAALYLIVAGYSLNLNAARLERTGDAYQRPLMGLLEQVPLHLELSRKVREGNRDAGSRLTAIRNRIDEIFDRLAETDNQLGETLQFSDDGLAKRKREHFRCQTMLGEWKSLRAEGPSLTAAEEESRHVHLVADIRTMITHAGDTSGLILDPDLDSYYLMDATLLALPQALDRLSRIQADGEEMLRRPTLTADDRVRMAVSSAVLKESDLDRITADIETSLLEDRNFYGLSASLQQTLPPAAKQYADECRGLLTLMNTMVASGPGAVSPEAFAAAAARTRAAGFQFWETAVRELDKVLDKRVAHYDGLRQQAVAATLSTLLLSAIVGYVITRNITAMLGSVMDGIGRQAAGVAGAASRISSSGELLAQDASRQATSLEQVSASSEEINAMAHRSTAHSASIAKLVTGTGQKFNETNRSLAGMIVAMGQIDDSSTKIFKIIKLIDEIAFQTNILALNAAVEAARAGDAGMGFAVVANEVRNLAQRCAGAARETSALIEDSISKSKEGRARVEGVAGAIRAVTAEVLRIKTLVEELNQGGQEQAHGIDQITEAIRNMDKVAKNTALSAQQSLIDASELSGQSHALKGHVDQLTMVLSGR